MKRQFSEEQSMGFLKKAEAGIPVRELCRKQGSGDALFYAGRSKFGRMDLSDSKLFYS